VAITADRLDGSAKAEGKAIASAQGQRAEVTVNLDLGDLVPGTYYLATTHDGDPASYFYPLTVRWRVKCVPSGRLRSPELNQEDQRLLTRPD
jgi:hypothetical protein